MPGLRLTSLREVNRHVAERFSRNGYLMHPSATFGKPVMKLNVNIREYVRSPISTPESPSWVSTREIPTAEEIGGVHRGLDEEEVIEIPPNKIEGPWIDKEEYFKSHYELLREDAVAPLRSAVEEVRATPMMTEYESNEHAAIYENVSMTR